MKSYDCKQCKVAADRSIFLTNLMKKLNLGGKEKTSQATVLSRRIASARLPTQGSTWDHWITFLLSDGSEVELLTPEEVFRTLPEGASGSLTWQGDSFVSFKNA